MPEQSSPSSAGLRFGGGEQQHARLDSAEALGVAGGDFTFEAWIQPQGLVAGADLAIFGADRTPAAGGLQLLLRNGRLYYVTGDRSVTGLTPLQNDIWYQVALRYSMASGKQTLLVNGIVDAQADGAAPGSGGGVLAIGRGTGADGSATYFQGVITEVRLWQEARSDEQIQNNLYRRLSGLERHLAGYWPLDEGAGVEANDRRAPLSESDGQPLQITTHNGVIARRSWSANAGAPLRTLAPGVEPTAVVVADLNGTDAGLTVPNAPALAIGSSMTVEAWVRPGALGTGRGLEFYPVLSMFSGSKGWELRCGNGQCAFVVILNNAAYEVAARDLVAGVWLHIAAVYDGQTINLYVNGVYKSFQSAPGPAAAYPVTPYPGALGIGCNTYWPDRWLRGQLAEVRLWNRACTQLEIQQGLFGRRAGDEDGLVGLWSLEGDGTAANSELNATARGGVAWVGSSVPLPDTPAGEAGPTTQPVKGQRAQLNAARARVAALEQANKELAEASRVQREQLTGQIAQLVQERAELARRLDELRGQAEELQHDNEKLAAEKAELVKGGGARTTLQDFVQNANDSIKRARAELRRQGSSYSLERVSLEVKMVPGPAGEGMFFPQPEELGGGPAAGQPGDQPGGQAGGQAGGQTNLRGLDPNHLSVLSLEFAANEPQARAEIPESAVPSVIGYTEIMARRKLADAGFQVARDFQAVVQKPGEPIQADRVVEQLPRAGEKWPLGGAVTIFIGREATPGS